MIVYADTSFWLSFWNERDVNFKAAVDLTRRFRAADWVWCQLLEVEVPAAIRAATHRPEPALSRHVAEKMLHRWRRGAGRALQKRTLPLQESVSFVETLLEANAWNKRFMALDTWHVAAAWSLNVSTFLTFDGRQAELARSAGLDVPSTPAMQQA
jgi:predicted nucleic acid-binding protein